MNPVAIVVPAWNASRTIAETLISIQKQTRPDLIARVYVADDASSDSTAECARACWSSAVPLAVSVNDANRGERATVNALVDSLPAEIEWFLILHADDIAKPEWVERMCDEIASASPDRIAVTASYDVLFEDGRIEPGDPRGLEARETIPGGAAGVRGTLKRGCWFKISSCAVRAEGLRELGGFRTDMPQLGDWEFVLRSLRAGRSIAYIPLCLSYYRQTAQNVSSRSFKEHRDILEALPVLQEYSEYLSRGDVSERHIYYLGCLARRSARSLVTGDIARLGSAWTAGLSVLRSWVSVSARPA